MRIARIFASHRLAASGFTPHHRSHRIAARIARYGPVRFRVGSPNFREEKSVHNHHRKKNLSENFFWPQRKTFQAGGGYDNPIKTRKPYPPLKSFPCGPHFFLQREVLSRWSRGRCMVPFFPEFTRTNTIVSGNNCPINSSNLFGCSFPV